MKHLSNNDPDFELWLLLGQTRDLIRKFRQKELNQYGIPVRQAFALFIINSLGNKTTPSTIARWMFQEPHSISELLSRMERKGLVTKLKNPERKNRIMVILTQKGREAYRQTIKRESIHIMMSSLSGEERQKLVSCLQVLKAKVIEELGIPTV